MPKPCYPKQNYANCLRTADFVAKNLKPSRRLANSGRLTVQNQIVSFGARETSDVLPHSSVYDIAETSPQSVVLRTCTGSATGAPVGSQLARLFKMNWGNIITLCAIGDSTV